MPKAYVDENNKTVFVCPACGFEKQFDASLFKNKKKNLNIKCKCGQPTSIDIEFRKHVRKEVELFGTCIIIKNGVNCDVIIRDLSLQGIGIEFLFGHRKYIKDFKYGDLIHVEFELDNNKGGFISKDCFFRLAKELRIGAEFRDDNFSKQIGFYLMQ